MKTHIVLGFALVAALQIPAVAQNVALKDPLPVTPKLSVGKRIQRVASNVCFPILHPKRFGGNIVFIAEHPLQAAKKAQENGAATAIGLGAAAISYGMPFFLRWIPR